MKRFNVLLGLAILVAIVVVLASMGGEKERPDLAGRIAYVDESYGNVRSDPDETKDNVLTQLFLGDEVILTGEIYENVWSDGTPTSPVSMWYEVMLEDGTTGWMASRLLKH